MKATSRILATGLSLAVLLAAGASRADERLSDFAYPYPVGTFALTSQGQALEMAYMDVAPEKPNGRTIVLLHGKNFCGATWEATIAALHDTGYRVVAPDQIGFCRSSKPQAYQFSFQQLAHNTHALLQSLRVERPIILGHSTGGMIAVRYALMYPADTSALVLANPIGLEDWKAKGVPAATVDELFARELKVTTEGIKHYEQETYYAGTWKPEYDRWVNMLAGMYQGEGVRHFAWDQALTADMIYTQPVVYEFPSIKVPTLLLIGQKDITAMSKDRAPAEVKQVIGHYPELGRQAAAAITGSRLVEFADLGHAPQIQDPARFNEALITNLDSLLGK